MKKGFTLAETLTTLAVIGIIASITVPVIINKHTLSVNRTKIKNAIAVYDTIVRNISKENYIGSVDKLNQYVKNDANCSNIYNYIKAVDKDGCVFKTPDGVWFDVGKNGTMAKAIVAFKKTDLTTSIALNETNYKAFYFQTEFDKKKRVRIIDSEYAWAEGKNSMMINTAKIKSFLGEDNPYRICKNGVKKSCIQKVQGSDNCEGSNNGTVTYNNCKFTLYDSNGNATYNRHNCNAKGQCNSTTVNSYVIYSKNGDTVTLYKSGCDTQGDNCTSISLLSQKRSDLSEVPLDEEFGTPSSLREDFSKCSLDTTYESRYDTCSRVGIMYTYKGKYGEDNYYSVGTPGNVTLYRQKSSNYYGFSGCDSTGKNCTKSSITIGNGGNGDYINFGGCDGTGKNCTSCSSTNTSKFVCPDNVQDFTKNDLHIFENFSMQEHFSP